MEAGSTNMSALQQPFVEQPDPESQIAMILEYRYGDGMVYLPRHKPNSLYSEAKLRGYIDAEGYLTRKGRALIARFKYL